MRNAMMDERRGGGTDEASVRRERGREESDGDEGGGGGVLLIVPHISGEVPQTDLHTGPQEAWRTSHKSSLSAAFHLHLQSSSDSYQYFFLPVLAEWLCFKSQSKSNLSRNICTKMVPVHLWCSEERQPRE